MLQKNNITKDLNEFQLIDYITKAVHHPNVIKGIGDDCAVLEYNKDQYLLVTTDMLVNNNHFKVAWYKPEQIGKKIIESNVSDIAACGGLPLYAVVSLCIPKKTDPEFLKAVYHGMYEAAEKYNLLIIGGDTTSGAEICFSLTIIGTVKKQNLCLRSDAEVGDLIGVIGTLGKSMAGLQLFLNNKEGYKDAHLEPKARLDISKKIAPFVNAMIDISDGLSSEIKHICDASNVGAVIQQQSIPVNEETKQTAKLLNQDLTDWALYGGEDFELLFTVPENIYNKNKQVFEDCTILGKITPKEEGCYMIDKDNKKTLLGKGYDNICH